MSKTRNPEAICGTCPYYANDVCYRMPTNDYRFNVIEKHPSARACGEHPQFFKEENS